MDKWVDIYPELVNKIRWAIQTALSSGSTRYPYRESQVLATVLSQDVINVVKSSSVTPGVLESPGTIRGFFQQTELDKRLNAE